MAREFRRRRGLRGWWLKDAWTGGVIVENRVEIISGGMKDILSLEVVAVVIWGAPWWTSNGQCRVHSSDRAL
jgi:hypothetical protein